MVADVVAVLQQADAQNVSDLMFLIVSISYSWLSLQNEVNAIKWDPSGSLLASCSDDMTLKVTVRVCPTAVASQPEVKWVHRIPTICKIFRKP